MVIVVKVGTTEEFRRNQRELLCAYDLVFTTETKEEVKVMFRNGSLQRRETYEGT